MPHPADRRPPSAAPCPLPSLFWPLTLALCTLYFPSALLAQQGGGTTEQTRVDYPSGLVYFENYNEGYFTGITSVESLDTYLNELTRHQLAKDWRDSIQRLQQAQQLTANYGGLIPEINLPKLPLFGEGSKIDITGQDRISFGGTTTTLTGLPPGSLPNAPSWLPS